MLVALGQPGDLGLGLDALLDGVIFAVDDPVEQRQILRLVERVIEIAKGGLERRARLANGRDETLQLAPLAALVEKGESPADALLRDLPKNEAELPAAIVARTAFRLRP